MIVKKKEKSKSKKAAAIVFELFIMGVVFMVFEDAETDSEVKIKIQDGDSKKSKISSWMSFLWFSRVIKMIVKSKSKSKMAAAIIFELFIMGVVFMVFEGR